VPVIALIVEGRSFRDAVERCSTMWNTGSVSTVQSVERAFAVLRCLGSGPAGVSDIAERTGLPKSTVSRLLGTLVELDAVTQLDPNGAYGLGELILDLSASATPGRNLVGTARPVLEDLVDQLGESAGLGVLDGRDVYYLDQVNSDQEVQVRDWTGDRVQAHAGSAGLVLLAFAPASVRARFLGGPLTAFTDQTIVDPVRLSQRLDETDDIDLGHGPLVPDDELVEQMHDDLYDGLADEVVEGTTILLATRLGAQRVLDEATGRGHAHRRHRLPRRHPVRARGAAGRQRHEGGHGDPAPAAGRDRRRADRQDRDRHRQGRHPRHRQEPGRR
jgi:DNA-binding IclR family transcriptional regulator